MSEHNISSADEKAIRDFVRLHLEGDIDGDSIKGDLVSVKGYTLYFFGLAMVYWKGGKFVVRFEDAIDYATSMTTPLRCVLLDEIRKTTGKFDSPQEMTEYLGDEEFEEGIPSSVSYCRLLDISVDYMTDIVDDILAKSVTRDYSRHIAEKIVEEVAEDIYTSADRDDWDDTDARIATGRALCRKLGIAV